jgi:hypothetical protein
MSRVADGSPISGQENVAKELRLKDQGQCVKSWLLKGCMRRVTGVMSFNALSPFSSANFNSMGYPISLDSDGARTAAGASLLRYEGHALVYAALVVM